MSPLSLLVVQGALLVLLPLLLWGTAVRRLGLGRRGWAAVGYGSLFFLAAFVVDRVVRLVLVALGLPADASSSILFALVGAVSAEGTRYLALRGVGQLREALDAPLAAVYGLGHGGFEALVLGLITLANARVLQVAAGALTPGLSEQLAQIEATPGYVFLLGILERGAWIALHVGLSMVVASAVVSRARSRLAIAVLWHATTVAGALGLRQLELPPLVVLIWLAAAAAGSIAYGAARLSSDAARVPIEAPADADITLAGRS